MILVFGPMEAAAIASCSIGERRLALRGLFKPGYLSSFQVTVGSLFQFQCSVLFPISELEERLTFHLLVVLWLRN